MSDQDHAIALQRLLDEQAVIRIANALDRAVDGKDWVGARAMFADWIRVDMGVGPSVQMSASELVGGWCNSLGVAKTSMHMRSNYMVDFTRESAVLASNLYLWNRMEGNGDPLWETWGQSRYELHRFGSRWKITAFGFRASHERGNQWVKATPAPAPVVLRSVPRARAV